MCDELGDETYMREYVEEYGGVLMCTTLDCLCAKRESGTCAKKEHDYYHKFDKSSLVEIRERLRLLSGSLAKGGNKDEWMKTRVSILKLLAATRAADTNKAEL